MPRCLPHALVIAAVLAATSSHVRADDPVRQADDAVLVRIAGRTVEMGLDDAAVARLSAICETTGDTRCAPARFERERGHLEVEVAPFLLDRDEVSRERYQACVERGPCPPVDERACALWEDGEWVTGRPLEIREGIEATPVTCVTLTEANTYCHWVGARLPTEAEWAAAAGVGLRAFPWGDEWAADRANHGGGPGRLESAREQHGQPWGGEPRQLAGNAYEWVIDGHPCAFGETCEETDRAVIRGGSFVSSPGSLRSTYRRFVAPDTRSGDLGFRCAAALAAELAQSPSGVWPGSAGEASPSTPAPALGSADDPRALAASGGRLLLLDLASGAELTLYETAGRIRRVGRIDADTIGFEVDPPLGGLDHYVWPSASPRPYRSLVPADYERVGDPLDACRSPEPSPYRIDAAGGTVSVRLGEGPEQTIFRIDPALGANLTATASCLGDFTVVSWSVREAEDRVRPRLALLDAEARAVARSEGAYRRVEESGVERPWVLWTPDRSFLWWSDYRGWFATDLRSGRTRAAGSSDLPPVTLAPGVEWSRPAADESPAEGPAGAVATELGATRVRRAPLTTDATGSGWVTLPGDPPLGLFEMTAPPDGAPCVDEAGLSDTPVWLLADEPATVLAWTSPPRFYRRDECLVSWPAFSEDGVPVEAAARYGLDRSGERTIDDWETATLVLEHSLLEGEGSEALRYEDGVLSLYDASGHVLASVPLVPIYTTGWEEELSWAGLWQLGPERWRARVRQESNIDNTGLGGEFGNTFTVTVGAEGLRLVDVEFVSHTAEDRDELPAEVAREIDDWNPPKLPRAHPASRRRQRQAPTTSARPSPWSTTSPALRASRI